jgi:hypothetical protein
MSWEAYDSSTNSWHEFAALGGLLRNASNNARITRRCEPQTRSNGTSRGWSRYQQRVPRNSPALFWVILRVFRSARSRFQLNGDSNGSWQRKEGAGDSLRRSGQYCTSDLCSARPGALSPGAGAGKTEGRVNAGARQNLKQDPAGPLRHSSDPNGAHRHYDKKSSR